MTDVSQLAATLANTVSTAAGNLVTDEGGGEFGADGGFVKSVTIDNTTYTFAPGTNGLAVSGTDHHTGFDTNTHILSLTLLSGALLALDMDNGAYTYKAPASLGSDITETVGYTLSDNDGDTSASTLSINVAHDVLPPIVRNDHVFTNDDSSSTVVISDAALTHNDTDAGGHTIVVGTITNASSGDMATHSGSSTTFTNSSSRNGGSFDYTGSTASGSDTGHVVITRSRQLHTDWHHS